MNLRDAALYYLRRGYGVLPVGPDKRPLLPWKELQDRYLSEGDVETWWGSEEPAQLALLTGPISGGLAVLDIDDKALAERIAQDVGLRAETTLIRTPRGGLHVYVTERGSPSSHSGPLIAGVADLKAEGGYVLAPPSRTPVGAYRVVAANPPKDLDKPARAWALALLKAYDVEAKPEREPLYKEALKLGATIRKGNRNATLASIAGKLRHSLNFEEGLSILLGRNQTLQPPLPETEVQKIAESVWAYAEEEGVNIVTLNTVDPEAVSWLWYPRFPMGKLTILAGPAGVGKSTLLLDLAARVTRGAPLPDGGGPAPAGDVVLLTAEDGLADTVRPRVDRQGGDPRRIHVITGVKGPNGEEWFSLAEHLPLLKEAIHRFETILVIVDPIIAYTHGIDTHRAAEVRGMLAPVAGMAEEAMVCVAGIMHLNKRSAEAFALHRITGAQDFTAAPRVVSMVGEDPEDNDGRRRVFLCLKNNLAPKGCSLGFHFGDDGGLFWDGEVTTDATKLLAAPASVEDRTAIDEARDFLIETLSPGAQDTQRIFREAKGEGIAIPTLRRAATLLGVIKFKAGTGGPTGHGYWSWRLPDRVAFVQDTLAPDLVALKDNCIHRSGTGQEDPPP